MRKPKPTTPKGVAVNAAKAKATNQLAPAPAASVSNLTKKGRQISVLTAFLNSTTISSPSFHEIRSLASRLYEAEYGKEFAQKLLGHKSMKMTNVYLDSRKNEWVEI